MALESDELRRGSLENARSLHRFGARLIVAIARAQPPYAAIPGKAISREINRALIVLALAELIHQPKPPTWQVTDPLVVHMLRGLEVPMLRYEWV
jgi:hypothetical protein